jgi:hypothetical protein
MAHVISKRTRLSRRTFLRGMTAAQGSILVGLPPLVSMFNVNGTAYAADTRTNSPVQKRFVFWSPPQPARTMT